MHKTNMFGQFLFPEMNNEKKIQIKKTHPRAKFSKAEDEILRKLVENYGDNNWQAISNRMPGRNSRQCRERWQNYLSPDIINGPWTLEEDELLVIKYRELGPCWKHISTFFPTRTDINIKSRWNLRERHLKKEDLKIKKAILKNKVFRKCSSLEANLIQNRSSNFFHNIQPYSQFSQNQSLQQVKQNNELIKQTIKKDILSISKKTVFNSETIPYNSEEIEVNNEPEHEINLGFDYDFNTTAEDCVNYIAMNQENAVDQWL